MLYMKTFWITTLSQKVLDGLHDVSSMFLVGYAQMNFAWYEKKNFAPNELEWIFYSVKPCI